MASVVLNHNRRNFINEVGIEFTELKDGTAIGHILIEEKHLNINGAVDGGCIFTLMDSTSGLGAVSHGNYVTTSNSSVMYLTAAMNTRYIKAIAKPVKIGKTLLNYDVEVFNDAEAVLAKGSFTFVVLAGIENNELTAFIKSFEVNGTESNIARRG